jgi:hypothetical protein
MEKHVAKSFVKDIPHKLCHVKNNIQNGGKIWNRFTVAQQENVKMLNSNWTEVGNIGT